jgi:hypothetical protein
LTFGNMQMRWNFRESSCEVMFPRNTNRSQDMGYLSKSNILVIKKKLKFSYNM